MYMARNTNSSKGICGINMLPSYPTKTSPNPPPSPDPSPTKCSLLTYCPAGSTCCCSWRVLGFCLSWSCCGLESAVCCKDTKYCCPQDYPVCDTTRKQCLKALSIYTFTHNYLQCSVLTPRGLLQIKLTFVPFQNDIKKISYLTSFLKILLLCPNLILLKIRALV
jgi:Granulin